MRRASWLLIGVLFVHNLDAQVRAPTTDPMQRALAAERTGATAEAATLFGEILAQHPAEPGALFGVERVLRSLDRTADLIPLVQKALTVDSNGVLILQIAVRTFSAAGRPDLARRYTIRWADRVPEDPTPFEEWSSAAADARDRGTARAALDLGRQRLKDPTVLAPDFAALMVAEGNIAGAAREWAMAVKVTPEFLPGAASVLARTPANQRAAIRTVLQDATPESRRLLGLVEIGWGNSAEGAALVRGALPTRADAAALVLESAIEMFRGRADAATTLARAGLLDALSQRQSGAEAVQTRLDAARAYADAGAERDARRLLTAATADPAAPAGTAGAASAAMLGVLLAEGKAAEAEQVLQKISATLDLDGRERETRRVALAYARSGDFAKAELLIANDSSTGGLDLRGRLRLFAGDIAAATELFKAAGPYDDEREHAVERVTLLVLMQSAGKDSSQALGSALLALERGDSAKALKGFEELAPRLAPAGAAEARLLASQLALAHRDTTAALRFLRLADDTLVPGVAPAARFQLARLSAASGKNEEAQRLLERLILDYPESAVVPEARRFRDALRGAVPRGGG